MRYVAVIFTYLVLLVGTADFAAGSQEDKVNQEIKRLEGIWKLTSLKLFGKESNDERDKEAINIFKDDKWIVKMKGNDDEINTFRLDMTKDPMHFDLDGKMGTAKGIYLLKGDTLTICFPFPFVSKNRPARFESDREGKAALMVLKRQKNP